MKGDLFKGALKGKTSAALKDRPASEWATTLLLVGMLSLGLLLRLLHFWAISEKAFLKIPIIFTESDMYAFWEWAQRILAGDLLGRDTYHPFVAGMKAAAPLETWYRWWGGKEIFHQAPLYPYGVATVLAVSGNAMAAVLLVQLLLGALQPLVLFGLARRLFDERVGLVAAALTALYGPFIFYQGVLLRDWLPPLLEPLALLILLKARGSHQGRDWLLAGAALSLALLAKETVLLFLPLVGLWLLWEAWPEWREAVRVGAFLLTGLLLCLSPLLVRNILVGAPLFALSNRAAQSFIGGNAIDSLPMGLRVNPATRKDILERSDGRLPAVIRETLKTYQGDYGAFLHKQLLKLQGLADPYEIFNNESFAYGLEVSPVLRFTLRYGFIFPLGIAGFLLTLPAWRRQRLIYFYFLATLGGLLFSMILARYRLILVPVVILYAAAFLVWMADRLREKRVAWVLGGLGLVLVVAVVQQVWMPLYKPEEYLRPHEYYFSAKIYASEGRFDRAVAKFDRLREIVHQNPRFAEWVATTSLLEGDYRAQWAKQLLEEGKREEARRQVARAEAAYARRVNLNPSVPYYNLGQLYFALDEPTKARVFFKMFLAFEPDGPRADRVRRLLAGLKDSR